MKLKIFLVFLTALFPFSALARNWRQGDKCPEFIKTLVSSDYGYSERDDPRFRTMDLVHEALSTCPNITSLYLRVTGSGCSSWSSRWNFPFKLEGVETYPPLKELRLEGYNLDERPWEEVKSTHSYGSWYDGKLEWLFSQKPWQLAKGMMLELSQRNKTNLDLWMDAMDWSQMESLALLPLRSGATSEHLKMAPALHSLQRLELSTGCVCDAVEFISPLPNNESLTQFTRIGRPLMPMKPLLQRHGNSLKSIEIRAPEWMSEQGPIYNHTDLTMLREMTPNLTHLSINLHRNGTWPLETLELIASHPSLRAVDFWLDMASECRRQRPKDYTRAQTEWERENPGACVGEVQFQEPFVNETSTLGVFNYMREKNAESGGELTNVTFWVGNWRRPWGGPLYTPDWIEHRQEKVSCSMKRKREDEAWCVAQDGRGYWKPGYDRYD